MSRIPPYIRDPRHPRCTLCGRAIYVQAEESSKTVKIGKQEIEKMTYAVRQEMVRDYPFVMSACKC